MSEEITIERLRKAINIVENQQTEVWKLVEAWATVKTKLQNALYELEAKEPGEITIEKIMSLDWGNVHGPYYKKLEKFLQQFRGISCGGYYPETNQLSVRVAFDQNKDLKDQLDIMRFIPFIKPIKHNKFTQVGISSSKVISIFENTLSEHGSYDLHITDDKIYCTCISYRHPMIEETFTSIEDALKYVYDNHPYELRKHGRR